ncbi:MAG: hypothetical protein IJ802_06455, partial [Kiritimatiellae bacterium]|nr:hypothetical protein [Kiritimatiellia bacterium]
MRKRDIFNMQALALPVAVIALVGIALACGGRVAAWEWWLGVAAAGSLSFLAKGREAKAKSFALFAIALAAYWVAISVPYWGEGGDAAICHIPAIELLKAGWNPVYEGTPEMVERLYGLEPDTFKALHTIVMPKGVWYYGAAAQFFSGNEINLLFPIMPVIALALAMGVWRFMGGASRLAKGSAAVAAFFLTVSKCAVNDWVVDYTIAAAGAGLLMALARFCRGDKGVAVRAEIFAWAFIMACAKPAGCMHCAIFIGVFAIGNAL